MGMREMTNDDEIFAQMTKGLDSIFDGVEETTIDFTMLDDIGLLTILHENTEKLRSLGQLLNPVTQEARDAHSLRNSAQIELRKRGLK